MTEYVRKGQIGHKAAIRLARDVLFNNSNKVYGLGLAFSELEYDSPSFPRNVSELGPYPSDLELLQLFLKNQPTSTPPDFVRICWNDYTAVPRMRMVPFRKFMSNLNEGKSSDIGIAKAVFGMI